MQHAKKNSVLLANSHQLSLPGPREGTVGGRGFMKKSREENTITFGSEIQKVHSLKGMCLWMPSHWQRPTGHWSMRAHTHTTHIHLRNTRNCEQRMTLINTQTAFHLQTQLRRVRGNLDLIPQRTSTSRHALTPFCPTVCRSPL